MLQFRTEGPEVGFTSTGVSQFGYDFSRIPIHSPATSAIQTKLAVNQPGDEYEQEADRVSGQVTAPQAHPGVSSTPPFIRRFWGQSNRQMEAAPASVDQVLASPGRPLEPALRQDMERRFGHDFARVRVHTDAAAEQSARDVNAHAYTVGHNIVFNADAFTSGTHEGRRLIAHELTHVVQQQPVLQRKPSSADKKDTAAATQAQADAPYVLWVLDDVFQGYARLIDQAPSAYRATLSELLTVKNGVDHNGFPIPGRRRREMLDDATRVLRPIMAHANAGQNSNMAEIRASVLSSEASDRVEHSFSDDKKKTIEIPTDSHPREQAEVFRARLQKLISAMHDIHEIGLKYGEPLIEEVAHHMAEGHLGHGVGNTLGRLQELQAVLHLADGWLKLNDEEFLRELTHIKGVFHGVSTYAELVKAVIEIGGGAVSLTATFAAGIARLSGDLALSASASSVARTVGMTLGNIIAGIEIVHGAAMLFDPHSTRAQRIEGGVEIGMGVGFLAGGGAGAMVVGGPYFLAKTAADLYWQGAIGLNTGFLLSLYEYMQEQGNFIAHKADALARAGMLGRDEKDPEKAAALAVEEKRIAVLLGATIEFIPRSLPTQRWFGPRLGQRIPRPLSRQLDDPC